MISVILPPFLRALAPGERTPCHGQPENFISDQRNTPAQRYTQRARALCARCPVQQACADWATATRQPDGIWGGLTPDERAEQRAARRHECGTETAWRAHRASGESCLTCREAHDSRLRADRHARLAAEHAANGGSLAGYRLEILLGLPTCLRCRAVRQDYYAGRPRAPRWYRRAA